jgi:AraC family transcriptional regulator, ethanolamine operon transcriptional activator
MDEQPASTATDDDRQSFAPTPGVYAPFCATDAVQLSQQTGEWNFEVSQLTRGPFESSGTLLAFDGVSLLDITISQTVLQRGSGPRDTASLSIPRPGTTPPFANGQLVEAGQCATLLGGEIEAVTHRGYTEVNLAFDMKACRSQLEALNGESIGVKFGAAVAAPGQAWIAEMSGRVDWLLQGVKVKDHGASLSNPQLRMSLSDHFLAAMTRFDPAPADIDSTTRAATAGRRVAVRLAREYIHGRLAHPLPLSELCRHANLKVRTLETGFREVTGLTPIAYIRSLRLNAVRRALHNASLQTRSISAIALDNGFWHLSQFATDYRKLFGETPTKTRRRSCSAQAAAR